jgi:hypothetical protein
MDIAPIKTRRDYRHALKRIEPVSAASTSNNITEESQSWFIASVISNRCPTHPRALLREDCGALLFLSEMPARPSGRSAQDGKVAGAVSSSFWQKRS